LFGDAESAVGRGWWIALFGLFLAAMLTSASASASAAAALSRRPAIAIPALCIGVAACRAVVLLSAGAGLSLGNGLRGLRERFGELGWDVEIDRRAGFRVTARVPAA
ncbi:MAG: hypothetical protein ACTH31_09930, partial [Pseudoclavibacter sp.]